ncbi:uncharacterized protein LOC123516453 isoform X1 [Portunus trituberculatus]|uniref:uncharacterized protein LOC123516453 isoform X1 n=1 Tax=Portunus trituberculatus TaxID=210409 RepID=UPI001E1CFBDB|nr:uncharacterized protein LOC123516453 isoform X1 [Portunus trituberculatus]XP_045131684.1 uncharacterized protein LOC123516453 isoform X1 [Portunus trituberculatus]
MLAVREQVRAQGVSAEGADIIVASWTAGTEKQYRPHFRRWSQFCSRWNINSINPNVSDIINFLSDTFHRNVRYESVITARNAISSLGIVVDGCRAGNHSLVIRFMKGVFNLRPPLPRYAATWDVQPVLRQLQSMHPLHTLSLKDLTLKLVMLMALTQAVRLQTLHLLTIKGLCIEQDFIMVPLSGNIKQCRPQFNVHVIKFQAYLKDASFCVYGTLRQYLARTQELRQGMEQESYSLFLSFIKPHKAVTRDTIARWLRKMLDRSGIGTTRFTVGSVRATAASKAKVMAVPINCIMAKAGWTRASNFAKFYDRHVGTTDPFQDAILQ